MFGYVVASVVRVTGRNRHDLDQWNDSFSRCHNPNQMDWLKLLISNIACWEGENFKTESLASPGQFFGLT